MKTLAKSSEPISREEIERINEMHIAMRRTYRRLLKDGIEMGKFFLDSRERLSIVARATIGKGNRIEGREPSEWSRWLTKNFPKIQFSNVYRYMQLASNQELIETLSRNHETLSIGEAISLIRKSKRQDKPRVRTIAVSKDSEPLVLLEARLKNYIISLWQLRYLATEIDGLIKAAELKPEEIERVLRWACREHGEIAEEVMRTFSPFPRLGSKSA
jgi:hypothetical protein